jgi:hypothetical protein
MAEDQPSRSICFRESNEHFYVAIKRPLDNSSDALREFVYRADGVRVLDEGSQVFIFSRGDFVEKDRKQKEILVEYVEDTVQDIGKVAIYKEVLPALRSEW